MEYIKSGDSVLIIWKNSSPDDISSLVDVIKSSKNASACLENSDMITDVSRPHSSFDIVMSNWLPPHSVIHNDNLLAMVVKLLKPNGKLLLKDEADLNSALKLNGFINVTKDCNVYIAEKPKFEIGSKASLKLGSKPAVWKIDNDVEAVWNGPNEDDLIDENQLLDEDDLKRPDKESLRVCATTGKRKACADCSCGLADELRGETKETPKSSCGSCYLGDAFRCATCPYLGMPAFKPGEKVKLDLNSDI